MSKLPAAAASSSDVGNWEEIQSDGEWAERVITPPSKQGVPRLIRKSEPKQLLSWLEYSVLVRDGLECTTPFNYHGIFNAFVAVMTISNEEQKKTLGGVMDALIATMRRSECGEDITPYIEWVLLNDHERYYVIDKLLGDCNPLVDLNVTTFVPKLVEKLRASVATSNISFIAFFPMIIVAMKKEAHDLVRKLNIQPLGEDENFPLIYVHTYRALELM